MAIRHFTPEQGIGILPTRGRPGHIKRLSNALAATKSRIPIMLVIDRSDPCYPDYIDLYLDEELWKKNFVMLRQMPGDPCTIAKVNYGFHCAPGRAFYLMMDDDSVPITFEWDALLADRVPPWGLSYANNGFRESPASWSMVDGELLRALGWFFYPECRHLFGDVILATIARQLGGCNYIESVVVEHLHPIFGKADNDATYRRQEQWRVEDHTGYSHFQRNESAIVEHLREKMNAAGGY